MNRSALLIIAVGIPVFAVASDADSRLAPACGPNNVKFDVTTPKRAAKPAAPSADAAAIYVIEDDSQFQNIPKPTVRVGLDGEWVGATHGNSYFAFPVTAGQHHLCLAWQSKVVLTLPLRSMAVARTVEVKTGEVLYFRLRNVFPIPAEGQVRQAPELKLELIDADEGQLLTNRFPMSVSRRKT